MLILSFSKNKNEMFGILFLFIYLFIQCLKRVTQLAILASLPCGPLQKLKVQIISKKSKQSSYLHIYTIYTVKIKILNH